MTSDKELLAIENIQNIAQSYQNTDLRINLQHVHDILMEARRERLSRRPVTIGEIRRHVLCGRMVQKLSGDEWKVDTTPIGAWKLMADWLGLYQEMPGYRLVNTKTIPVHDLIGETLVGCTKPVARFTAGHEGWVAWLEGGMSDPPTPFTPIEGNVEVLCVQ